MAAEQTRLLVIEDDATIAELLTFNLEQAGYRVLHERDGSAGLRAALAYDIDLVILDLMLPQLDGITVCQQIKHQRPGLPVIMLTARGDSETLVEGFAAGADDYVTKPFKLVELFARIRARLRADTVDDERSGGGQKSALRERLLDSDTYHLRSADGDIPLQPKEHDLLALLATEPGRLFTREELTQRVWHQTYLPGSRSLDVRVRSLRAKLEAAGLELSIEAVRGVGYRLVEERLEA